MKQQRSVFIILIEITFFYRQKYPSHFRTIIENGTHGLKSLTFYLLTLAISQWDANKVAYTLRHFIFISQLFFRDTKIAIDYSGTK